MEAEEYWREERVGGVEAEEYWREERENERERERERCTEKEKERDDREEVGEKEKSNSPCVASRVQYEALLCKLFLLVIINSTLCTIELYSS